MEIQKKRFVIGLEILLVISLSFSISYLVGESLNDLNTQDFDYVEKTPLEKLMPFYSKLLEIIFSKNIVSAIEGASTCLEDNSGFICQEYLSSECDENCKTDCIPARRQDVSQCELGTCYSEETGTCQEGSTKQECEDNSGKWFDDPYGNVPECKLGCCVLDGGDNAIFTTEGACKAEAVEQGFQDEEIDFRQDIQEEWACVALTKNQEEGACVFQTENIGEKNECKFGTKAECLQSGGDFYKGTLCSHPDLETKCEPQKSTSCVEGKDEIYWFDSCGNRENIYSANKAESFNEGLVLSKSESCSVGTFDDPFKNQDSCGNCAYLQGSVCGAKTGEESLADSTQDVVCRDMRCVDSEGQIRDNGESWCGYNSAIGVEKGPAGYDISVDTPGSRHARFVCLDGEVKMEACADYRNEVCVEQQYDTEAGQYSNAACKINRWQQCLNYNGENSAEGIKNSCSSDPNCFVKHVEVDDNFKFDLCAPKYAPGFDLDINPAGAEGVCAVADVKCTYIEVKDADGDWNCKENCECKSERYAQQMNDLCVSLGDCGSSVNYVGALSENHQVQGAPSGLGASYLKAISKFSEPIEGKYATPENTTGFNGYLGFPDDLGQPPLPDTKMALGTIGMAGMAFGVLAKTEFGLNFLSNIGLAHPAGTQLVGTATGEALSVLPGTNLGNQLTETGISKVVETSPSLNGLGTAVGAAFVLYSAYNMIAYALDVGPVATGIVIGSIVLTATVFQVFGGGIIGGKILGLTFFPALGIALAIVFGLFKLLGVGDTREKHVYFTCKPWQAPFGGSSCQECGKDGFPCTRYSCNSLGQTCDLLNEGSGFEECVNIAPDDVSPPIIKENPKVLSDGFEYKEISSNGFLIERLGEINEGCVSGNEKLTFGIELNEPGQCKYDVEDKAYDEMLNYFGDRNLFLRNHTMTYDIPSLESLGIPGYDPSAKEEYSLNVRCKDGSGNENNKDYRINFCVRPGEDLTAPKIDRREPLIEWVSHNQTKINASVFVNEPAQCKYDVEDKTYGEMIGEFDCQTDIQDRTLYGWECNSELEISSFESEEDKIYVRCEDQPWLIEDYNGNSAIRIVEPENPNTGEIKERIIELDEKRERNTNKESYEYNIKRSQSPLNIEKTNIEDREIIISGQEPVSVEIIAKTTGGINGDAICRYVIGENEIPFFKTGGKEHRQVFQEFNSGKKSLKIECSDMAGNEAGKTLKFEIKLDTKFPRITRIFDSSGELEIVTNEPSVCAYVIGENSRRNQCNFDFDSQDIEIMNGAGLVHTSVFDGEGKYFVKCKDDFGNIPSGCSAIIKRGS